jgi:hypothetical protein
MVASQFMTWGKRGPGEVTIWASTGHVFMTINGVGFGTSGSNPGGGAGRLPYNTPQYAGFVAVHPPDVKGTFVPGIIGSAFVPGNAGAGTTVELVSWDHVSTLPLGAVGQVPMTPTSLGIARTIFRVGTDMGVTDRMMLEAFMAALDESQMGLTLCCSGTSVGVFQQISEGWGSYSQRANPATAARSFFEALRTKSQNGTLAEVVDSVQHPRDGPPVYARYEAEARRWLARIKRELSA